MTRISVPIAMHPVEKSTNSSLLILIMYIMHSTDIIRIKARGDVENFANHCENIADKLPPELIISRIMHDQQLLLVTHNIENANKLIASIQQYGGLVCELHVQRPSLEDVFVKTTQNHEASDE